MKLTLQEIEKFQAYCQDKQSLAETTKAEYPDHQFLIEQEILCWQFTQQKLEREKELLAVEAGI